MVAETTTPHGARRLNPFPFPSDTTLRFVLLAIFVICGSAALHGNIHEISDAKTLECSSGMWSNLSGDGLANGDARAVAKTAQVIATCVTYLRPAALWKVTGILLTLLVAAVIYHLLPIWIVRSRRLEPITSANVPELDRELQELVTVSGLSSAPEFVWNPLAGGLPTVFGCRGQYRVSLSGAFVSQVFMGDRSRFRVIVLHELAHIRTGDIPKTYFSIALLAAFLTTAVAPTTVVAMVRLFAAQWVGAFHLLFQVIFWTVIALLAGLSVLRAREYYADVQASVWQRGVDLHRTLDSLHRSSASTWRRALDFHPDPSERRRVVEDPSRLFGLTFADAFGIGVAAWLIIDVATFVIIPLVPLAGVTGLFVLLGLRMVLTLITLGIAIAAIGIGVWRGAFGRLVKGQSPYFGAARMGLALVAGALPGRLLVMSDALRMSEEVQAPLYPALVLGSAIDVILFFGCVMIFRWIAGTAMAWFVVAVRSRSPKPFVVASVGAALLLVAATFGSASFTVYFYFLAMASVQGVAQLGYLIAFMIGVPVFAASVIAWAFPFASEFCARRTIHRMQASWIFLDDGSDGLPVQTGLSPRGAIVTGVFLGLLYWLSFELIFFRDALPETFAGAISLAFDAYVTWVIGLTGSAGALMPGTAAATQAAAAVLAAAMAVRLPVVHGICAASCSGLVITAGNILFFGLAPPVDLYGIALSAVVLLGLGAVLSVPSAVVAAAVGRWFRVILPDLRIGGGWGFWRGLLVLLSVVVVSLMLVRVGENLALFSER